MMANNTTGVVDTYGCNEEQRSLQSATDSVRSSREPDPQGPLKLEEDDDLPCEDPDQEDENKIVSQQDTEQVYGDSQFGQGS